MKAWLLDRIGDGIAKLRLADFPDPWPASGEIVLRLLAASLNPADRYLAEGQYPARPMFPHILGRDGVGVVEAVGDGVDPIIIGQRRVVLPSDVGVDRPGTFAEQIALPMEFTAIAPSPWSEDQAAAAPLVYLTAWQALMQWGHAPRPELILISGASGGVGVACVQIAKSIGSRVIALSRDSAKAARLHSLGAAFVFNSNSVDWTKKLLVATNGQRVDLAVDNVGGPLLNAIISVMNGDGRISVVGALAGAVPDFNTAALLFRQLRIGGVIVTGSSVIERQQIWNDLFKKLPDAVRPMIDSVHPMAALPEAFIALSRGPMGKVILRLGS